MDTNRNHNDFDSTESYEKFVQLLTSSEPGLRAFVRSLLPGTDYMDEVMQETCLVLWRKFSDYRQGTEFLSWAITIARFEVLKYRRKLARDRHVFNVDLLAILADEAAIETEELAGERRKLDHCIEQLATPQRELIQACYAQGVTFKQVAQKLGKSATSLYKTLNRIRILLLECIENSESRERFS